jgi:hypothetical protein
MPGLGAAFLQNYTSWEFAKPTELYTIRYMVSLAIARGEPGSLAAASEPAIMAIFKRLKSFRVRMINIYFVTRKLKIPSSGT